MSNSDKILDYLSGIAPHPECDDCISKMAKVAPRQTVYQNAERLAATNDVVREKQLCSRCGAIKKSTSIRSHSLSRGTIDVTPLKSKDKNILGLKELKSVGFKKVGLWVMAGDQLSLQLSLRAEMQPALYAFISSSEILYVGKTSRSLSKRLYHYSRPGPSQRTNLRLNELIMAALSENKIIEIYAFGDAEERKLGPFDFDIPAAIEDDVIRKTKPVWNRRK